MTEAEIQLLIQLDIVAWESYLPYLSARIQQEIIAGTFTGLTQEQILEQILQQTLTASQIETLISTALNNYNRSVNRLMLEDAPEDQLLIYIGPQDTKTRTVCSQMAAAGPLTESEVISNFGSGVLNYGGGYNCRHAWEMKPSRVTYAESIYGPNKARELLQDGI